MANSCREATVKKYLIVQIEGNRQVSRVVDHYNLDAILAVGYRVRSHRGTQFRIWATERLREYLVKGFAMDDARLKLPGAANTSRNCSPESATSVRRSGSSGERCSTSTPPASTTTRPVEASTLFFKTVQNKMHWAAHGHTAAEIVHERTDASQPNMGLTSWSGDRPRKTDVSIAKNYLQEEEIEALNRIVTAYLEFAELQALNRNPMTMADWIAKLDDFLQLSDREILSHAGKISHEQAKEKAEAQYESYRDSSRPRCRSPWTSILINRSKN